MQIAAADHCPQCAPYLALNGRQGASAPVQTVSSVVAGQDDLFRATDDLTVR